MQLKMPFILLAVVSASIDMLLIAAIWRSQRSQILRQLAKGATPSQLKKREPSEDMETYLAPKTQ